MLVMLNKVIMFPVQMTKTAQHFGRAVGPIKVQKLMDDMYISLEPETYT